MNRLWLAVGQIIFWFGRPVLILMLRGSSRSRVLVESGEYVLLIKNWIGDGTWSLPGGGIHSGETSREAVRRELFEETKLDLALNDLRQVGNYSFKQGRLHFKYILFTATIKRRQQPRGGWPEIAEARWFKRSELGSLKLGDDCLQALRS